jgi:ubiquinone/menaquinone biosynthesis C-methylase UbiE
MWTQGRDRASPCPKTPFGSVSVLTRHDGDGTAGPGVSIRTGVENAMTTQEIDPAKVQEFGGKMLSVFNGAALSFMTSIGHQTGLFDAMATLPPSTSAGIAEAAGLNERYVREWLGAVTTGGIVTYDSTSRTYFLPREHAALLTRAAGPGNMAVMIQMFPLFGTVESGIVESFRKGGGVPYSAYPEFQRLMSEVSSAIADVALVGTVLPLVPGLKERLDAGIDAADVGCGMGHTLNVLAKAFPKSRFTGYDFSAEGIAGGTAEAAKLGLSNVRFVVQDAAALNAPASCDLVTVFDAIHDQAKPDAVLKNIANAVRPGGTYLMVDVAASSNLEENLDHPMAPALYTISTMHCMTVSLAQGGEGLGAVWGEQKALQMLAEAGFTSVEVKRVEGDIFNNYYICSKG